mgnify:CR=1 FL=1
MESLPSVNFSKLPPHLPKALNVNDINGDADITVVWQRIETEVAVSAQFRAGDLSRVKRT